MSYQAVIFDFNGVLVDDEPLHCELTQRIAKENGIELTRERYYQELIGFDDYEAIQHLLKSQVSDQQIKEWIQKKNQWYMQALKNKDFFFSGAVQMVKKVGKSKLCAINSGALKSEIVANLKSAGLSEFFPFIVSADDIEHSKPHPEGYEKVYRQIHGQHKNIKKEDCVVIEDTLAGIQSAQAAELPVIAITNSYSKEQLASLTPVHIIERLEDLLDQKLI